MLMTRTVLGKYWCNGNNSPVHADCHAIISIGRFLTLLHVFTYEKLFCRNAWHACMYSHIYTRTPNKVSLMPTDTVAQNSPLYYLLSLYSPRQARSAVAHGPDAELEPVSIMHPEAPWAESLMRNAWADVQLVAD